MPTAQALRLLVLAALVATAAATREAIEAAAPTALGKAVLTGTYEQS